MRILVCGSRDYSDSMRLNAELDLIHAKRRIHLVIEGEAKGADVLAREWAESRGIPVWKFPAEWKKYGLGAGPVRNERMLDEGKPELVIAFPSKGLANSKGTKNMVNQARAAGVETIVIEENTE